MLRAKVIKLFPGVPTGQVLARPIEVGEEIDGDLARVAIDNGWAEELREAAPEANRPSRGKAAKR